MKMNEKDAEQCSVSPKIVDVKFNKTCIKTQNPPKKPAGLVTTATHYLTALLVPVFTYR